jgi:hypothetical protein
MTNDINSLPDYPALEQLALALWRDGTVRGAGILVGAGFSRNASTLSADAAKPPLWNDLNNDLVAELYLLAAIISFPGTASGLPKPAMVWRPGALSWK